MWIGPSSIAEKVSLHADVLGLNFKLRIFNELDANLVSSKSDNPWIKSVVFSPQGLEHENDKEFIKRLNVFANEFSVKMDQLPALWESLKSSIRVNDGDEEAEE